MHRLFLVTSLECQCVCERAHALVSIKRLCEGIFPGFETYRAICRHSAVCHSIWMEFAVLRLHNRFQSLPTNGMILLSSSVNSNNRSVRPRDGRALQLHKLCTPGSILTSTLCWECFRRRSSSYLLLLFRRPNQSKPNEMHGNRVVGRELPICKTSKSSGECLVFHCFLD